MRKFHLYDLATGLFTGRTVLSDAGLPEPERVVTLPGGGQTTVPARPGIAIPDGCGALEWPGGQPLRTDVRKVDVATGQVVPYQPAAPAADAMQTWAWDATAERWQAVPTLAVIKRDAKQAMAAAWNTAREAGVTLGGKVAPTDAAAWTRYLAIKQMAADGGWTDIPIPLLDGNFHLLTQAQAGALWTALKDMERTLLARLKARVESIAAATTAAEVSAIVW